MTPELKEYITTIIKKYFIKSGKEVDFNNLTDFEKHLLELAHTNYKIAKQACVIGRQIK